MGALRAAAATGAASPDQVAARERLPPKASFVRLRFPAGTSLADLKASLKQLPEVDKAAHEVVREAQDAGVWVFGGGLESQRASVVATDGMVTDGPYPETKEVIGGFAVVDVPSREEALEWAAKIAVACRCAQEVRELLPDPTV